MIRQAILYAQENVPKKVAKRVFKPILEYWQNDSIIEWGKLCKFTTSNIAKTSQIKISLAMLVFAIENDILKSDCDDKFKKDLPNIKKVLKYTNYKAKDLFTEKYDCVFFAEGKTRGVSIKILSCSNEVFLDLYISRTAEQFDFHTSNKVTDKVFLDSVEDLYIDSYKDINDVIFWKQINYVRGEKTLSEEEKDQSLRNICSFYRWLVVKYNDYDFFANSSSLTTELILSNVLIMNIKKNAYFTLFSETEDLGDRPRIVIITKNLDRYSTMVKKNDYIVIDSSILRSKFYRKLINRYVQTQPSVSILTKNQQVRYVITVLSKIEELKNENGYPNPELNSLNTQEAVFIKKYCKIMHGRSGNLVTSNNRIGSIRRFLFWCKQSEYITFSSTFFDYLSQYEEPNKYNGNAISDEDLAKINEEFIKLCKEDDNKKIFYAIFLILIETEFRLSQVLNLKVSSLVPTLKKDQYLICSNTKTSKGRVMQQPICLHTKHILDAVIEQTEELRKNVITESDKDSIFLYKNATFVPKIISKQMFQKVFRTACNNANVMAYNSKNLRDTHMTKSFEYIMKNGKSDLEMGLLSKHKYIDTTKSHYIQMELTKMLESTYKVTLGNRDITQKTRVLEKLPESLRGKENIVENGCGCCTAKQCNIKNALPCLICKDFVTTYDHEPYFIRMIEEIDTLIAKAKVKHEVEDLNLIKSLYASWLREIYLSKEEGEKEDA